MKAYHLIAEHGVLVNFNIAKRISADEIKKITSKIKKKTKTKKEFNEKFKDEIVKVCLQLQSDTLVGIILAV